MSEQEVTRQMEDEEPETGADVVVNTEGGGATVDTGDGDASGTDDPEDEE